MRRHLILIPLFMVGLAAPTVGQVKPIPRAHENVADQEHQEHKANHLKDEKSPYLRQHVHNPIDWWPWSDAAFAEAKKRDVPVFLSIGYSTCHWCHVMEKESFEDAEVAKWVNAHYVCIKVDREERPDVDAIYMAYVQAVMNGNGGWPASLWLDHKRRPFMAATYLPPEPSIRSGSYLDYMKSMRKAWDEDRPRVEKAAEGGLAHLKGLDNLKASDELAPASTMAEAAGRLGQHHDDEHGGWGVPKFPQPSMLRFMLAASHVTGTPDFAKKAALTLSKIARGGIYDHVGGGLHRYSTDAKWLVPHFEKMLYDQTLMTMAWLDAGLATGDAQHLAVARDVLDCLLRDFRHSSGGFQCAYDADSGGEEGSYYLWGRKELAKLVDDKTTAVLVARFDITEDGNWHEFPNRNILEVKSEWTEVATELKLDVASAKARWEACRATLRSHRDERPRPGLDTKILAGWNGLAISALARGGRILGEPRYLKAAREAATFLLKTLRRKDGSLARRWCDGQVAHDAVLTDHAFLSRGLLDLYEATGEDRWLASSLELARAMIKRYQDPDGGFRMASAGAKDLIVARRSFSDGAIPSGNTIAVEVLLRLGDLTSDKALKTAGLDSMKLLTNSIARTPTRYPELLIWLPAAREGLQEIVVVGDPADKETKAMLDVVNGTYLPNAVLCLLTDEQADAAEKLIPLLAGKRSEGGRPRAFVCRNGTCKEPADSAAALAMQLK